MAILLWLVVGALVAAFLTPYIPGTPRSRPLEMAAGVLGGVLVGWIGERVAHAGIGAPSIRDVVMAFLGAVLALNLLRRLRTHKAT
ncbi:MAG: hypothetical protein HKL92_04625 [Candidatus Eremiobacteraeota bacterium]|nr:hypothetical protein [Candidatus Eremiobacteraeota bacterium]NNM92607.1 hypothetical protein [Candidatus Eremiobacteraeota bacterium]